MGRSGSFASDRRDDVVDVVIPEVDVLGDLSVDQFEWSFSAPETRDVDAPSNGPLFKDSDLSDDDPVEPAEVLNNIPNLLALTGDAGSDIVFEDWVDWQRDLSGAEIATQNAWLDSFSAWLESASNAYLAQLDLLGNSPDGFDAKIAPTTDFTDVYGGEEYLFGFKVGTYPSLFVNSATIDIEFHETGYCIWADPSGFSYGVVNPYTGKLFRVLNHVEAEPTPIREVKQGPEFLETTDGLKAVGTTDEGLVLFDAHGSELLAGTAGYSIRFMPKETVDRLYFTMFDADSNVYMYDEGVITALDVIQAEFPYWLSSTELLVYNAPGYAIYDLETGTFDQITTDPALNLEIGTHATVTEDGDRMLLLAGETYSQLLVESETGWDVYRDIVSPFNGFEGFYSAEFVEWQGRTWLSGFTLEIDGPENGALAKVVLYDIENNEWSRLTGGFNAPRDPESFALETGNLGIYYFDKVNGIPTTIYKMIRPEDITPVAGGTLDSIEYEISTSTINTTELDLFL